MTNLSPILHRPVDVFVFGILALCHTVSRVRLRRFLGLSSNFWFLVFFFIATRHEYPALSVSCEPHLFQANSLA